MSMNDRVSEWLMRFFLAHPNATTSVKELSISCRRELQGLQSQFSWQEVARSFVHNFAVHHAHHGRLTQHIPSDDTRSIDEVSYQITPKGQSEFAALLKGS